MIIIIHVELRLKSGFVSQNTVLFIQRADGTLTLGRNEHNHLGQEGALLAAKITARAKKDALDDLFKPAMVLSLIHI